MYDWKNERNYRRVKDEHGNTLAYIISVDDKDIEVTEEVYMAYSQMDRHERYLEEQSSARQISFDRLQDDAGDALSIGPTSQSLDTSNGSSIDDDQIFRQSCISAMMASLTDDERNLLEALYIRKMSLSEYARSIGIPRTTLSYQKKKLLKKVEESPYLKLME